MTIVIPFIDFNGPELKYCLRGIDKFIIDPDITIIGDKPKRIKNITHIHFKDIHNPRFKAKNIYQKIMLVDHDFLFFNDDHFLLSVFNENTYHYSGTIKSELTKKPGQPIPGYTTKHI